MQPLLIPKQDNETAQATATTQVNETSQAIDTDRVSYYENWLIENHDGNRFLSKDEVAKVFGVSGESVKRHRRNGNLKALVLGHSTLKFDVHDVATFIVSRMR